MPGSRSALTAISRPSSPTSPHGEIAIGCGARPDARSGGICAPMRLYFQFPASHCCLRIAIKECAMVRARFLRAGIVFFAVLLIGFGVTAAQAQEPLKIIV